MRFAILGTTEARRDDGTPVPLGGARLRALLAALALHPGREVPSATLIDAIWPDDPPQAALRALQALVGRLRRALGPGVVLSGPHGYRLAASREEVDYHRFVRLCGDGTRALDSGDAAGAVELLREALALWRGPAFADLPHGPGRDGPAARAEQHRLTAVRGRVAAELRLGRSDACLPELRQLVAEHPLDETLHVLLIRALRDSGRSADALTAWEEARRRLADELGADPGPELRRLHRELLAAPPAAGGDAGDPAAGWPAAGAPGAAPTRPSGARRSAVVVHTPHTPHTSPAAHRPNGPRTPPAPRTPPVPPAPPEPEAPGAPGTPRTVPGNIRLPLTSFVGREEDLAALHRALTTARLVTLVGPGGSGKTRLSLHAARALADSPDSGPAADGAWFAPLAALDDGTAVPGAVLSALGLRDTVLRPDGQRHELPPPTLDRAPTATPTEPAQPTAPSPPSPPAPPGGHRAVANLIAYIADRRILLVLDNCEHVIQGCAELVEALLSDCPRLTVLATSREPLGIPGEVVRPVDPLPTASAMRLLAERGAAARPGFTPAVDPAAAEEICRRLDGLPLAIELAAARLRSLTPRQIADRLDDRFHLLTGGSRTALPRQQTLRAVVDWSWGLLEPAERALLRRLSVFSGGWTLEAAEDVCADPSPEPGDPAALPRWSVLDRLSSLVDKSLVVADQPEPPGRHGPADPRGTATRYRMLETIAEYATERLHDAGHDAERRGVQARHVRWYRRLAVTADRRLRGPEQLAWMARLEVELDNVRTALDRAVADGDESEALLLVLGMAWFWSLRDYVPEARAWVARVGAMGPDPLAPGAPPPRPVPTSPLDHEPPLTGEVLLEARRAIRMMVLVTFDDSYRLPPALTGALRRAYHPGLPQAGRMPGMMWPLTLFVEGERAEGFLQALDDLVATCRRFGGPWETAFALMLRAKISGHLSTEAAKVEHSAEEALELFTELGDRWGIAESLEEVADAAARRGDFDAALVPLLRAARLAEELGVRQQLPLIHCRTAEVLLALEDLDGAEHRVRLALSLAMDLGRRAWDSVTYGRFLMAQILALRGDPAGGRRMAERALASAELGSPPVVFTVMLLALQAWCALCEGRAADGLALARRTVREHRAGPLFPDTTDILGSVLAVGACALAAMATAPAAPAVSEAPAAPAAPAALPRREDARRAAVLLGAAPPQDGAETPLPVRRWAKGFTEEAADALRRVLGEEEFDELCERGRGLSASQAAALLAEPPEG
ncbi:AfsR/SARP family transcriptional regulator [Allostreptomyces psammosilenae]|uniref:Putative ATPase/DNA-binding SARP family transcriptional activator n=1 Tax=Allostreptomyces psammosilenae TaxID=1892865 RepID=A0A852ZYM9_9ACTN|nr:BTAD domain-containing putative transcriptional regulator [Allostreptomyces psammosilenae]NYI05824.1 putative ATPase/DNA-binding SARP family transcriptional activator [Allostreptomyces psammosilenae]